MLLGAILGFIIAALAVAIFFLLGANRVLSGQFNKASEELFETRATLGRFMNLEQERQRLREAVNVNFTEEQITTLANRIGARYATIHETEQQAALNKMD